MATLRYLLNYLLLALLVGCAPDRLASVSQAPPRSIGPELTVFPSADVSSLSAVADPTLSAAVSVSTHGITDTSTVNPKVDSLAEELSTLTPNVDSSTPPLTTRQQLTLIYQAEVGTREIGKNNHGPGPKKYLAVCNLPEGYAYCACFVKWALLEVGIATPGTAWSPTWANGKEIYWKQGKFITSPRSVSPQTGTHQSDIVQPGDVFTLYYQHLKRVGHVGFVHIWDDPRADDWVFTVEGNTNGEGSREGDGVHSRRRLKRSLYTIGDYIDTSI